MARDLNLSLALLPTAYITLGVSTHLSELVSTCAKLEDRLSLASVQCLDVACTVGVHTLRGLHPALFTGMNNSEGFPSSPCLPLTLVY